MSKHARYSWIVLGYNILVILFGAFVRATGSGAGCGAHWPLCNGEVLPGNPQIETLIEFSHRVTSGLALMLVLVLFFWTLRQFPKMDRVRKAASWSLAFIILEALIGAGLVLFELVAANESTARVVSISLHLVNTFLLLGALTLTSWWSTDRESHFEWNWNAQTITFAIALVGMTFVGMIGAITALGDTLFPSTSLVEGFRQDFSATSHILLRLRVWHPVVAVLLSLFIIFFTGLIIGANKDRRVQYLGWGLIALVSTQLIAGVVNLALLAPIWMQIIHLLLADLVWILLVLFSVNVVATSTMNLQKS